MNILHVTPSFYPAFFYGGPTHSVFELCAGLARHGNSVTVLTTDANGPSEVLSVDTSQEVQLRPGLNVRYCHRVMDVSVSPRLLALLPSYISRADVVHLTAVYSFTTIPTMFLCKKKRKPMVWSPRGALQRWPGTPKRFMKSAFESLCRSVLPRNAVLHCTSDEEAQESGIRISGREIRVIPNGVEIPSEYSSPERGQGTQFLYLGRLHPKKCIENLLSAFCELGSMNASLIIAGEGDLAYSDSLKARIKSFQLENRVQMVGAVYGDKKHDLLASSDCTVVPSHTENFAIVVAESLAHGVPVIASRGTPWRQLEQNGCGFWVDNDPRSLAAAMRKILDLPMHEMGARGREWMRREFSLDSTTEKMSALYKALVVQANQPN